MQPSERRASTSQLSADALAITVAAGASDITVRDRSALTAWLQASPLRVFSGVGFVEKRGQQRLSQRLKL